MAKSKQVKKIKKAQSGVSVTQDKKGYTYTKKVKTSSGPRYYSATSPDLNMAETMANFKAKRVPADSTRRSTLSPSQLKNLDEKKKGGVVKKVAKKKK